jgi:hypothetical protein
MRARFTGAARARSAPLHRLVRMEEKSAGLQFTGEEAGVASWGGAARARRAGCADSAGPRCAGVRMPAAAGGRRRRAPGAGGRADGGVCVPAHAQDAAHAPGRHAGPPPPAAGPAHPSDRAWAVLHFPLGPRARLWGCLPPCSARASCSRCYKDACVREGAGASQGSLGRLRALPCRRLRPTACALAQDRPAGSMAFRLAAPGVLRRFEGRWRLLPAAAGSCQLLIEQEASTPCWAAPKA